MRETKPEAMVKIFADEGGYTNNPKDPGGATIYGITIFDVRKYVKPNATPEDVKNLTKAQAQIIYDAHYFAPMQYDALFAGMDYAVVDAAINSGVGRAPQWLKQTLGTAASGMSALAVVANTLADKQGAIHKYWMIRLGFLHSLKTWQFFGKGWGRRCATGEALSVRLWQKWGLKASPQQQKDALQKAGDTAAVQSKKQVTVATGHTTGGAVTASTAGKWASLSFGVKFAIVGVGILFVLGLIYALYWAVQHNRRAQAFAEEMKAVA